MSKVNSIYEDCVAAGLTIDNHESDLYIKDCVKARELLDKHGLPEKTFKSQIDNETWLDIPFMYSPFWKKNQAS